MEGSIDRPRVEVQDDNITPYRSETDAGCGRRVCSATAAWSSCRFRSIQHAERF
jgi:hypothetical protein